MLAQCAGSTWEVDAPAKLNLTLEITGRRTDGYHEICSLMVPVSVCDTLFFRPTSDDRVELRVRLPAGPPQPGFEKIPVDDRNLAMKAIQSLKEQSGVTGGAVVTLVKRIPAAAGMGGGSSDAAAALWAANQAWRLNWPLRRLQHVAAGLGSDVPFFLLGSAAIARGRGEQLEAVSGLGGLHFVVVRPPDGLATADVYAGWQDGSETHPAADVQSRVDGPETHPTATALSALRRGHLALAGRAMRNHLQPAAARLSAWVRQLESEFCKHDVPVHQMTGSGTAYFGLCRNARHARLLAGRLRLAKLGWVAAARSCRRALRAA